MNCTKTTLFLIAVLGVGTVGLARSPDTRVERRQVLAQPRATALDPGAPALPVTRANPDPVDAWRDGLAPRIVTTPGPQSDGALAVELARRAAEPVRTDFGGGILLLERESGVHAQGTLPRGARYLLEVDEVADSSAVGTQRPPKVLMPLLDAQMTRGPAPRPALSAHPPPSGRP